MAMNAEYIMNEVWDKHSCKQESNDVMNIMIYSDGSCHDGFVGASAVLYYLQNGTLAGPSRMLCCQLGQDTMYSVCDAK